MEVISLSRVKERYVWNDFLNFPVRVHIYRILNTTIVMAVNKLYNSICQVYIFTLTVNSTMLLILINFDLNWVQSAKKNNFYIKILLIVVAQQNVNYFNIYGELNYVKAIWFSHLVWFYLNIQMLCSSFITNWSIHSAISMVIATSIKERLFRNEKQIFMEQAKLSAKKICFKKILVVPSSSFRQIIFILAM